MTERTATLTIEGKPPIELPIYEGTPVSYTHLTLPKIYSV